MDAPQRAGPRDQGQGKPQKQASFIARELHLSAIWTRIHDPGVIILMVCSFLVAIAFTRLPFVAPPCLPSFSSSPAGVASRFLIDAYPMPGPIPFHNLSLEAQRDFTINFTIPVISHVRSDRGGSSPIWSESLIQKFVDLADKREPAVDGRLCPYGPACNKAFFDALLVHPITGQNVLVVGSITPWLEAICLSFGANSTTTVDFTRPLTVHPRVHSMTIAELDASSTVFDSVFSYSSLEHDGLGRYGDPLNPTGDLQRMSKLMGLVRRGGTLFLGVPNGMDLLVFNLHRVYGRIRFPMLIQGWQPLGTYGEDLEAAFNGTFVAGTFDCYPRAYDKNLACYSQPVHVLKME